MAIWHEFTGVVEPSLDRVGLFGKLVIWNNLEGEKGLACRLFR